jgi:hypothetical protein
MDPISNVDRLVLLLRQRLQERERARGPAKAGRRAAPATGGMSAAQALAAIDDVDERHLRRALIQGLLSDQFGSNVINEARFQQIVDRVLGAIEDDDAGRALLDRISKDLRAASR